MKLLRVLDLTDNTVRHVYGIEHLVHLRYLAVSYITASIGRLVNLEFLLVVTSVVVEIPSVILKMKKLRYLNVTVLAIFEGDCKSSQTNNLEFLSCIDLNQPKDEEMLKCSPHLHKLKCKCVPFVDEQGASRYPDLRFLIHLESLNMSTLRGRSSAEINFPSNIKKLSLDGLCLPWEKMSVVGELPNLRVLKLAFNAFVGKRWETKDGEFQQLRFLKLNDLDIAQWDVASNEHFPMLQRLVVHKCHYLLEIPCDLGEIDTLQLIEVEFCTKAAATSAMKIQQEQRENGNEEFTVIIRGTGR